MKARHVNFRSFVAAPIVLTTCLARAQRKSKADLTGKYEGTAKNKSGRSD